MSDTSSAFPPPPPPSAFPPPVYQQQPVASPMPNYQPPPVAQPPVGYPPQWQQQPWQQPAIQPPGVSAGWSAVGILSQFEPPALWAILFGVVTIAVPFLFGRVFFFLPILVILSGARAIAAGKLIGGIVAIVLGACGGVLTLIGLFG